MTLSPKIILMHGKDTNPREKWYPWLEQVVNDLGVEYIAPILPQPENPVLSQWLDCLDKAQPDEQTILVGHSLGGVVILRWLERQVASLRVKKVILVATNAGTDESNNCFYTLSGYDFDKIKTHCDEFVVLHSTDDVWVPFSAGEENALGLGAKFLRFTDRGHFGKDLLKPQIPELLDELTW
jgi:uncharacterized protein